MRAEKVLCVTAGLRGVFLSLEDALAGAFAVEVAFFASGVVVGFACVCDCAADELGAADNVN